MEVIDIIREHWDDLLLAIGLIGVACETVLASLRALVAGLRSLALVGQRIAMRTRTQRDDRAVERVIGWLAHAADVLDRASAIVPRLRAGAGRRATPPPVPRGIHGALALAFAFLAIAQTGCGGSQRGSTIARATATSGAMVVVVADGLVADAYDRLTEQCDAGERDDCAERLRRLDRAERALGSLVHALRAVDAVIMAGQASRHCTEWEVISAVSRAARELALALTEAGIDVPRQVRHLLDMAEGLLGAPECVA
jgi:hypothetical protein